MVQTDHGGATESQGRVARRAPELMTWANAARALAAVLVALSGAWAVATQGCDPPPPAACADVRAEPPAGDIRLSRWDAKQFRLRGTNDCGREVTVHVEFRALSESFRFQPPAGCPSEMLTMGNPECWTVQTVGEGEVDWAFFPPALHPLGDPPPSLAGVDGGELVAIDMRWVVYADQAHIIDARTQRMEIRDDRVTE